MTEVSGPGATDVEDGGGQGGFRGLPQNMRKMYRQGQAGAEGRREQRTPGHGESAAGTDWSDLGNAEGERKKKAGDGRNCGGRFVSLVSVVGSELLLLTIKELG